MQISNKKTGLRVVVFSPDQHFGMSLTDWLNNAGHQAIYAQDLKAVFKKLTADRPHSILFDLSLSDTFGIEAFHLIRSLYPDLPVITMSDMNLQTLSSLSLSAGARASFLKPFEFSRMGEFLRGELTPATESPRTR
ncbi:MAG: response regulator [Nitrospirae bacterium]|nr:response regulator [Nitrospirota bacterium]